jgi:8-oxo-dGTP pyrophosphatase MutT (NUDIX family)
VDERDCVSDVGQVCHGLTAAGAAEILGGGLSPEDALGHFVAAIRETFEEAGVLLAVDAAGAAATLAPGELAQHRHALQNGDSAMADVITCLGLRLDTGRLRYFSHWITPPLEPRRFSARFFLCPVSAEQEAVHDAIETTDGVWLSPRVALARYAAGLFMTAPPTLRVLEQMAEFESIDHALEVAPHHPLTPSAPRFASDGGMMCLVLPGDPLHPDEPGEKKHRFEYRGARWFSFF